MKDKILYPELPIVVVPREQKLPLDPRHGRISFGVHLDPCLDAGPRILPNFLHWSRCCIRLFIYLLAYLFIDLFVLHRTRCPGAEVGGQELQQARALHLDRHLGL